MKLYKIKPLVWVDSLDKTIATANDSGGLRYTATVSSVSLYDEGEYQWSTKCKSVARGKQIAEELRLERIELNLEEVDQEPVVELLVALKDIASGQMGPNTASKVAQAVIAKVEGREP